MDTSIVVISIFSANTGSYYGAYCGYDLFNDTKPRLSG